MEGYDVIEFIETWIENKEWGSLKEKLPSDWKWKCQGARRECKKGRAMEGL